ncbi:hypothetical protein FZEAL_6963 [Fusarium zealandicum]|uniref:Uncharacterized protein n=1 Tax=Fusarium zealandicum TaxID=1053134 RepID=A0A8H4XIA9_9HYPO|nr:hypothetical protein FZEAL_6963 [Fusarium zealandicum]
MCFQTNYITHCWKCNIQLEPSGRMRPCKQALESGAFTRCNRGLMAVDVKGPVNMLCRPCLIKNGGQNCSNKDQNIVKDEAAKEQKSAEAKSDETVKDGEDLDDYCVV